MELEIGVKHKSNFTVERSGAEGTGGTDYCFYNTCEQSRVTVEGGAQTQRLTCKYSYSK